MKTKQKMYFVMLEKIYHMSLTTLPAPEYLMRSPIRYAIADKAEHLEWRIILAIVGITGGISLCWVSLVTFSSDLCLSFFLSEEHRTSSKSKVSGAFSASSCWNVSSLKAVSSVGLEFLRTLEETRFFISLFKLAIKARLINWFASGMLRSDL